MSLLNTKQNCVCYGCTGGEGEGGEERDKTLKGEKEVQYSTARDNKVRGDQFQDDKRGVCLRAISCVAQHSRETWRALSHARGKERSGGQARADEVSV